MANATTEQVDIRVEHLAKRFRQGGTLALDDFSLDIEAGELLVLLGPSGSGKTTLLNVLAGLEPVDSGRVLFGNLDVTRLPAERRKVGVVFQSAILYPHLNLYDNIAFAPRLAKVPDAEIRQRVQQVTSWLHLEQLLERRPHEVSGGQRQRAAIAKTIVARPNLLLMDEPFSALDAQLRRALRSEIIRVHRQFRMTTVFVTHDQEEAMAIADRVVIMRDGRLVQAGSPLELYQNPVDAWVAAFVGMHPINLVRAELQPEHQRVALFPDHSLHVARNGREVPARFTLGLRPEHVKLVPTGADGQVHVLSREVIGGQLKYTLGTGSGQELTCLTNMDVLFEPDDVVGVGIDWPHALLFDETSGRRIA